MLGRVPALALGEMAAPGDGEGEGEGSSTKSPATLTDIAKVTPIKVYYNEKERNAEIELEFLYEVDTEKLQTAKDSSPWIYDLRETIGPSKAISAITEVDKGAIMAGTDEVGTYSIHDSILEIIPDSSYMSTKDNLHGIFTFKAKLNEEYSLDKRSEEIEFPGGGKVTIDFKKKEMDHSKTVNGAQSGDVSVTQDADGNYILNYTVTVKPKDSLTRLNIVDKLSTGQTLVADSIMIDGQPPVPASLTESSNSGFTLDLPEHLGGKAQAWTTYTITYQAKVSKENLNKEMGNTAAYYWDGDSGSDNTNVTPHFEEYLETSKTVGGSGNSIYATAGNVNVEKDEQGNYYLYYRVTARPNAKIDKLTLTDTVGAGQTDIQIISATAGGTDIGSSFSVNTEANTISGTYQPEGGIPANTEVVLTYRVKLTKNADTDESVLSGVKKNDSKWEWKGEPSEDHTTVTPHEPPPTFPVTKKASVLNADPSDESNNTITYTITVGDDETDLSGYTFNDIIANYPFEVVGNIVLKKGDEVIESNITPSSADSSAATGAPYTLFSYHFPKTEGQPCIGPYTFTYTIKLNDNTGLAGRRALTNTGEIGSGSSTTTTTVDYGEPGVEKHWSAWDKENNSVVWTVIVTVPEGKSFTNLSVTEQDFKGGGEWYQDEDMSVDWSSLTVNTMKSDGTPGDVVPAEGNYTVSGDTVTFGTLSRSCILTLKTKLKEGVTFEGLNAQTQDYYVTNGVKLKVGDDDITTVIDKKKYEKAEYDFTKTGAFNDTDGTGRPVATWTVVINPEGHSFEEDVIPYFVDTIPEGMEFYGGKINIRVDGHGNENAYGVKLYQPTKDIDYTTSDREIGRINLVDALVGDWDPKNLPTGLSGMTFYVTYKTIMTEAKWAQVQSQIGTYTFTNKAKIVDEDGKTVKTTGDTITYEYREMVKKVDLSPEEETSSEIKYRIQINPNSKKINDGKTLELYDVLKTDVTLKPDSIRVYAGVAGADSEAMDTQALKYSSASGSSNADDYTASYTASYDDNSRKLQVFVPDETACVVEFSVIRNENSGTYQNTVVLRTSTLTFSSTVTKKHENMSSVTLLGDEGSVKLKKLDLFELNTPLSGAKFKLYRANLASDGTILSADPIYPEDGGEVFVSGSDGIVDFDNVAAENKIQEGKLYYWVETAAAADYMMTDPSPHYFVIYREYNTARLSSQKSTVTKAELNDEALWAEIEAKEELKKHIVSTDNDAPYISTEYLTAENAGPDLLQSITDRLNEISLANAKALDNKAQAANNIIVATISKGYTWNWRNPLNTAYAVLKGVKTLYGRELNKNDYAFLLQDMSDPDNPLRVQIVRNGENNGSPEQGAVDFEKGGFTFSELAYRYPGTYRYRITEYKGSRPFADVIYDTSVYDIEVVVTDDDLNGTRKQIPESQITYRKNGVEEDAALFFNHVDEASIVVTKTFSGDYPLSDGFKNQVTFTVREKPEKEGETGKLIRTFTYGDMEAGRMTLTKADGIEKDKEYVITESNADITGTVRTTTYTLKGVTRQSDTATASANTNGDKAAQVDFDNSYRPESMKLYIAKKWHLEVDDTETDVNGKVTKVNNKQMQALTELPGNVREAYFKLQRYTGQEPATGTDLTDWTTSENDWVFVNSNTYEDEDIQPVVNDDLFQNRRYDFTNWITVKAEMGWVKELEDLPIGRYRVVEIERDTNQNGSHWKPTNHGNVVYLVGEAYNGYSDGALHPIPHWQDTMTTPEKGVDNIYFDYDFGTKKDGETVYVSNRLYEIDFTKQWYDKDGNLITADNPYAELGVQSVTLQLQAATLETGYENKPAEEQEDHFSTWKNVTGQVKTIPTDAVNGKVVFSSIPRKDPEGNSLYYRVIETRMVLSDGTVLNAEQIAERFELYHVPTDKKPVNNVTPQGGNAYMHPADGASYGHQTVNNTEKPHGISVTKAWNLDEDPQDVYVQLRAKVNGGFTEVNDLTIRPDSTKEGDIVKTADGKVLYRIHYNSETQKYEPVTFSYLFRKNADGTLADNPTYNWADVEAVQFIEYRYDSTANTCTPYNDADHQVTYGFTPEGASEMANARDGISPLAIGTYTVGNNNRSPAVIKVTKNWIDRPNTDTTIYFKLYLVGENGAAQELYVYNTCDADDPNAALPSDKPGVTNPAGNYSSNKDQYWVNQYNSSIAKLSYNNTSNTWETLIYKIPAEFTVNNTAGNYLAGVYAVEIDEGGTALEDNDPYHISYSFVKDGDTATYSGIGPGKPTPAGSGTLTIQNAPPGTRPSVEKQWKSGDTEVTWPAAVKSVGVQLVRVTDEGLGTPTDIGKPIYLTAANPRYTWPAQEEIEGAIYCVKEVSVTWMKDGKEQTVTGSALANWVTQDMPGSFTVTVPDNEGTLGTGILSNKVPTEEKTSLKVSKTWVDEHVTLIPPEGGETVTLRLMSRTRSEAEGTAVTLTQQQLEKLKLVQDSSTNLVLTADEGSWPIGQILDLPRYRNGENVYYYVEELSATDASGAPVYYKASYSLNFSPELESDPKAVQTVGGGDELIYIVNQEDQKHLDVEKKWTGAFQDNHSEESVTVYLYSWTEESEPPVIDTSGTSEGENNNITNLKLEVEGLDAGDWWYISIWNVTKNNNYVGLDYFTLNQDSKNMPFSFPPMPYKDSEDESAPANRYAFEFNSGADGNKYSGVEVYLTGGSIDHDTILDPSVWSGTVSHDASPGELTLHFKFIPKNRSLSVSDTYSFAAQTSTASIAVYNIENLPEGATLVERPDNPVVLNSGANGWSYRWDNLPEKNSEGKKLYYAAVETLIDNTIALSNKVTYRYTYDDDSTTEDTITKDKNVVKVEVLNEASYPVATEAGIKIVKVDANGMTQPLTGAEFQLYRKPLGDNRAYETVGEAQPVLSDGTLVLKGLGAYDYRLVETKAPPGYVISGDAFEFSFSDRGALSYHPSTTIEYEGGGVFRIGNSPGVELPATGGVGAGVYRRGGALLLLAASGLLAASQLSRARAVLSRRRKGGGGTS